MIHSFDTDFAAEYGVIEAVIIQNLQFWIQKNRANKKHVYEGRVWTYNSVKAFGELFPYLTSKQIRGALERLIKAGVLLTGNFNKNQTDRTLWYCFADELKFLGRKQELNEKEIEICPKGQTITDSKPNNKPDIKLFDEAEEIKSSEVVIGLLNSKRKKYGIQGKSQWTKERGKLIEARILEYIKAGNDLKKTLEDIGRMIEFKCKEWKGTKFEKFIRVQTLFQASKFIGYMEEAEAQPQSDWTENKSGESEGNLGIKYFGQW